GHRSGGPSSTGGRPGRRTSSPIPCRPCWLTAGATGWPRRSSARTRHSHKHSPARPSEGRDVDAASWRDVPAQQRLEGRQDASPRMGDELALQRRELPWVAIDKDYRFDTDDGPRTLTELFDGRSQLLVYHFMFGPGSQPGAPANP